jgi:hypothetical protein
LQSFGGAGGYRGRRTVTDILRIVAIVLAILVVLLLVGLYFAQEYLVYTDDGLQVQLPRIELFFNRQDNEEEEPIGDVSVVEQPDSSGETQVVEEEPVLLAVQLPVSELNSEFTLQQLNQAGANALVLEMRGQSGQLEWYSQQPLAEATHVNGSDETQNDRLRQWNGGEVYTVALVNCFRDDTMPYFRNSLALRSSYGNWRDELGLRWLNPADEDVRAYLTELCTELAQMGFDEILLDSCAFPAQGNLDAITSQFPEDRAGSVAQFLAQVRQAVEPYGTLVSVRVDAASAEQSQESGLTAEMLKEYADRVWVGEGVTAYSSLGEDQLVSIRSVLRSESKTSQAVLSETTN